MKDYNFEEKIVSLLTDDYFITLLISHKYANYVVQKSLVSCSQNNKSKILKVFSISSNQCKSIFLENSIKFKKNKSQ